MSSEVPRPDEPRFEEMLERLKTTVEKLESGQLSLEESLRVYEEGVRLHRECSLRLDAADRRIERLLEADADGVPRTAPMETPREPDLRDARDARDK